MEEERKIKPKPIVIKHDLGQMLVSIVAFVINCILLYFIATKNEIIELEHIYISAVVISILISLAIPVIVRWNAYWQTYNPQGFSASFAENEYNLKGWIKGKYSFYDAILCRVNGNFNEAFSHYLLCLSKTQDTRLRQACYIDIARHMPNHIEIIPVLKDGLKEFPQEHIIFRRIVSYYLTYDLSSREEGNQWFSWVSENIEAGYAQAISSFFLGKRTLYEGNYEKAEELLLKAYEINEDSIISDTCVYLGLCEMCLGNYDKGREYLLQGLVTASMEEFENAKEMLDYIFKVKEGEINTQSEKLVAEFERREAATEENAVNLEEIPIR
ncbi:MAG: hypothetical protein J6A41_07430 [Ruminiclostridium sp.]|nr:hypothetical protein [Ruminiclostridium sp.]